MKKGWNRFRVQSSQGFGQVSRIRQEQALVIEGCIQVSGLSKLTNIHYESRGDEREWFRYRCQTSKFSGQYWLL